MPYPIILNGDHAEFEQKHASTKPENRPDWPLPSFDAVDWARAFCRRNPNGPSEEIMVGWFANALMRGFDEHISRAPDVSLDQDIVRRFGTDTAKRVKFIHLIRQIRREGESIGDALLRGLTAAIRSGGKTEGE